MKSKKILLVSLVIAFLGMMVMATGMMGKTNGQKQSGVSQGVEGQHIQGVEISAVNSVTQKGVKPANQMNLEKAIKLMTSKQKRSKSSPSAGAKISSGGKSKPGGRGPGKKDTRRSVPHQDRLINEGS